MIGAFAVVTLVRDPAGEALRLSSWAGLGKRSPLIAGVFAFFLIAFAGIPLTSGFSGKFAVFQAAVSGGALPLVIIGVLSGAILAFPLSALSCLCSSVRRRPAGPAVIRPSLYTTVAVAAGVLVTLWLGVAPEPLLNLTHHCRQPAVRALRGQVSRLAFAFRPDHGRPARPVRQAQRRAAPAAAASPAGSRWCPPAAAREYAGYLALHLSWEWHCDSAPAVGLPQARPDR